MPAPYTKLTTAAAGDPYDPDGVYDPEIDNIYAALNDLASAQIDASRIDFSTHKIVNDDIADDTITAGKLAFSLVGRTFISTESTDITTSSTSFVAMGTLSNNNTYDAGTDVKVTVEAPIKFNPTGTDWFEIQLQKGGTPVKTIRVYKENAAGNPTEMFHMEYIDQNVSGAASINYTAHWRCSTGTDVITHDGTTDGPRSILTAQYAGT